MMFGVGMGLGWIILLVIAGGATWQIFRRMGDKQPTRTQGQSGSFGETPLDILKKRYARGEITEAEYQQMKSNL